MKQVDKKYIYEGLNEYWRRKGEEEQIAAKVEGKEGEIDFISEWIRRWESVQEEVIREIRTWENE